MFRTLFNTVINESEILWRQISFQSSSFNYFYMLIIVSVIVAIGEKIVPWRKDQPVIRDQFFLDVFYMFFNYFIFRIIFYSWFTVAINSLSNNFFPRLIKDITLLHLNIKSSLIEFVLFFIILDFVQWLIHILLHRVPLFWEFHKVHHSVTEMSFPAHLRYHWLENIAYTPVKYLAVTLFFGFAPQTAVYAYVASTVIGHINHANIAITYGPFKYLLNNPVMHLWHHSRYLPKDKENGVNFGISLSIWDYIFRTNYIPDNSGNIELGFSNVDKFPKTFMSQFIYPFIKK